jgi:RND family efflux transporter MFP subunit
MRSIAIVLTTLALCAATASADETPIGSGYIDFRVERVVRAELPSVVSRVHVKEGQYVKRGDVLVVLQSDDLNLAAQRAQAEREEAARRVGLAEAYAELVKTRLEGPGEQTRKEEIKIANLEVTLAKANAKAAGERLSLVVRRLARLRIFSPLDGLISRLHITEGDVFGRPGAHLVTVSQRDKLVARVRFPAAAIRTLLAAEQPKVTLRAAAVGAEITGQVIHVAFAIDRSSQTILTTIAFDPKDLPIVRAGMKVTAELK